MAHPNGLFGWIDLTTTDVEAARAFYSELFGWTSEDMPTPMGPAYTMCFLDGKVVAGMAPQPPGMAAAGMPSMWNSYVLVDDIDEVTARVAPAGGAVVMPTMDVMTQGRMAMVADPGGAVVGLWQPGDHHGADVFNVAGSLTWNELTTRDLDGALPFYEAVFGWRWEESDQPGYHVAMIDAKAGDDKSNGGAMAMPDTVPAEVPNYWSAYIAVDDLDASVARAAASGGAVFLDAMEAGPGRFAGITDPTGGMIMLIQFATPPA